MLIPEKIYSLTARDLGLPWAKLYSLKFERIEAATAQPLIEIDKVPENRILILNNAAYHGSSDPAQTLTQLRLMYSVADVISTPNLVTIDQGNQVAAIQQYRVWSGQIWLGPNTKILMSAVFNAVVNPNTIRASLTGITIPLGSVVFP